MQSVSSHWRWQHWRRLSCDRDTLDTRWQLHKRVAAEAAQQQQQPGQQQEQQQQQQHQQHNKRIAGAARKV